MWTWGIDDDDNNDEQDGDDADGDADDDDDGDDDDDDGDSGDVMMVLMMLMKITMVMAMGRKIANNWLTQAQLPEQRSRANLWAGYCVTSGQHGKRGKQDSWAR